MGTKISRTERVLLEPGVYRVRVGRWVTVETPFNTCVEFRFDLRDKGLKRYCIEASVNAELIGGEQPSEVKVQAPGPQPGSSGADQGVRRQVRDLADNGRALCFLADNRDILPGLPPQRAALDQRLTCCGG